MKSNFHFERIRFDKIFLNRSVLDSEKVLSNTYMKKKIKIEMRHHVYFGRVITGLFYIYIVYHVKRCEDLPYMNYVFFSKLSRRYYVRHKIDWPSLSKSWVQRVEIPFFRICTCQLPIDWVCT